MITIEVLVRLAAADPWGFTVLDTLRRKVGFEEIMAVTRMKSWRLDFEMESREGVLEITQRLMQETALLANPNRDIWTVSDPRQKGLPENLWKRQKEDVTAFAVRVTDKEDLVGKSLARVLKSRLGIAEIADVHFSSVWVLEMWDGEPRARAIARDVAVSRSWRKGLLSNPHFQDAEIFAADEYASQNEVRA